MLFSSFLIHIQHSVSVCWVWSELIWCEGRKTDNSNSILQGNYTHIQTAPQYGSTVLVGRAEEEMRAEYYVIQLVTLVGSSNYCRER